MLLLPVILLGQLLAALHQNKQLNGRSWLSSAESAGRNRSENHRRQIPGSNLFFVQAVVARTDVWVRWRARA
jgi:hypothetical protein